MSHPMDDYDVDGYGYWERSIKKLDRYNPEIDMDTEHLSGCWVRFDDVRVLLSDLDTQISVLSTELADTKRLLELMTKKDG